MPSLISEHTQFVDVSGEPIVNGSIYIGSQNNDPVANPITIYSDRALTTAISNPQSTDSAGRSTNKIWVPGKYSIRVDDSSGIQQYQNLDAGDTAQTGITTLTNVAGVDTITTNASPVILALTDNQQYNFRAIGANTTAVTLQIDATAAKSILKQHDVPLAAGDIEANQTVSVVYNATDDVFELVSNVAASDVFDLNVGNDLTVTGDIIYRGNIQSPAVATGHVRAGNTQIVDGAQAIVRFDIDGAITVSTFETIGPTGSGATNIYAEMDVIPSTATIGIFELEVEVVTDGISKAEATVYACKGDVSPSLDPDDNAIGYISHNASASGDAAGNRRMVYIPLDSGQIFKLGWAVSNASSQALDLWYRGFMTD